MPFLDSHSLFCKGKLTVESQRLQLNSQSRIQHIIVEAFTKGSLQVHSHSILDAYE